MVTERERLEAEREAIYADAGIEPITDQDPTDDQIVRAIMDAFDVCDYEASCLINRVAENMSKAA